MAEGHPETVAAQPTDLLPDDVALARLQLVSGLPLLAEATLRRLIDVREQRDGRATDELDAARAILAEALWRQGRPLEAGTTLARVRAASDLRRQPVALMIEADAAAAAGHPQRAHELMERVVQGVGAETVWQLRGGVPSSLAWPNPFERRDTAERPPQTPLIGTRSDAPVAGAERTASAHARLEAARAAFTAGDTSHGQQELSLALRLDSSVAADGIALLESSTRGAFDRSTLMLYGDLLAAAGRDAEAAAAYDRAAADGGRVTG